MVTKVTSALVTHSGSGLDTVLDALLAGAGGTGSQETRIAVIGDSLSAQQGLLSPSWPVLLEDTLRSSGSQAKVFDLAINGATAHIANVTPKFGVTATMVDRAVQLSPNIVMVALGYNDAVLAVEGRSVATVKADFATLFSNLRTALPTATLVYVSELAYDSVNCASPSSALNKQVLPLMMQRAVSGITAGAACSEMLNDPAPSTYQTNLTAWAEIDLYVRGLSTVNTSVTLPLWKAARLGLIGYDGLHPTAEASLFWAAAVRQEFNTNATLQAALPNLSNQSYASFNEYTSLFDGLLSLSGGEYVPVLNPATTALHPAFQHGAWNACNPATWHLPSKGNFRVNSLDYTQGTQFVWGLNGCRPLTLIEVSVDGAAFVSTGKYTDPRGDWLDSGALAYSVGSHVFRYKVGDEIHGPITVNVISGSSGTGWQPKVMSGATLAAAPQAIGTANSRTSINFNGSNYVSSHGDLTFSKTGNDSKIKVTVPAGKSVWVRLSVTQLVSGSSGPDTLWLLGTEVYNSAGAFQYNLQLDSKYSPSPGYAVILGGTFVGKLTETTTFIPWVLTSAAGSGALADSAANGVSSYWSIEVINEI